MDLVLYIDPLTLVICTIAIGLFLSLCWIFRRE